MIGVRETLIIGFRRLIDPHPTQKRKEVVVVTTAPAPTPVEQIKPETDTRRIWPIYYSVIAGALMLILGLALAGVPIIFVLLAIVVVAVTWLYRAEVVFDVVLVAIIGLTAALLGWAINPFPYVLYTGLVAGTGGGGLLLVLLALLVGLIGTVGLLLAVMYRAAPWKRIVAIVCFGLFVLFNTQLGMNVTAAVPHEQVKQTCEQRSADFPAECK